MLKKIKELKLRQRLNSGYIVVILFMALSGLISIIGFVTLTTRINSYINEGQLADTAVKMCRIDVNIAARNIREMALTTDSSTWSSYEATVKDKLAEVNRQVTILKETNTIDEKLFNDYASALKEWENIGYEIIEKIKSGNRVEASSDILTKCAPALNEVVTIVKDLDRVTDEVKERETNTILITVIVCIVTILLFILLAVLLAFKIGKTIVESLLSPLKEVENAAQELSTGNLHTSLEYRSEDEIGSLADSLRTSISTLSTYVDDISYMMKEFSQGNFSAHPQSEWKGDFEEIADSITSFEQAMAETVNGIGSIAQQVANGASQVSGSSSELAQGATDQAAVTQELTATIADVAESVATNASNAQTVSNEVDTLGSEIVGSNEKMKEMVASMNEISSASNEISNIIETINNIASQTNLLALNASIEAARAGEAGRGFAVVADQVSLLAAQSSNAAKESTALIHSSLEAVEKGIVIVDETANHLAQLVTNSREITQKVTNIAVTLNEQNDVISQINHGVEQINDVVQTNSATSEECAAAAAEMTNQADHLAELIEKFKTV